MVFTATQRLKTNENTIGLRRQMVSTAKKMKESEFH